MVEFHTVRAVHECHSSASFLRGVESHATTPPMIL
jgi:hypothetical protein